MIIFWTGWGVWVFLATFAWLFVVFGAAIAMKAYGLDIRELDLHWVVVLWMALSAASVFLLARHRARTPRRVTDPATVLHDDTFMFIRMKYWTHILAAFAAWAAVIALRA